MKPVVRVATALAVFLLLTLNGCAGRWPWSGTPAGTGEVPSAAGERQWSCIPVEGPETSTFTDTGGSWASEGGRMVSSYRSTSGTDGLPGKATRDAALGDAVASATKAALGLLEQRGIAYTNERKKSIIGAAVKASLRGGEIEFPRMSVVESSMERCVSVSSGAPADTCWRATVFIEYPIGQLRGDANNVRWERSRAANEAAVLRSSAEDFLDDGRWLNGLLETARVAEIVAGTGVPATAGSSAIPTGSAPDDTDETRGSRLAAEETGRELAGLLDWSQRTAREVAKLSAKPDDRVWVVDAGATVGAEVEFSVTYEWRGRTLPAVGVPVAFRVPGASAILDFDPVTDRSGVAACRILRADGSPGRYELELGLDVDASRAALSRFGDLPGLPLGATGTQQWMLLSSAPIQLVAGAHATSVCLDLRGAGEADAAQTYAGFARRMERDGFRLAECGPEVGIVITGELSLSTASSDGAWKATATLTASAFDQRTATRLDKVTLSAEEGEAASDVADPRRSAEVLALKEVGRLLAVYFEGRMLSDGP